jgi:D-ribose pyranase
MKKTTLLHGELSGVVARLGHGDMIVIADAGLPVPPAIRCIDLAVTRGIPSFEQVLQAVLSEMCVERCVVASEMAQRSPALALRVSALLADVAREEVPHDAFKALTEGARAIVRTGEFTPYANVILFAGVVF